MKKLLLITTILLFSCTTEPEEDTTPPSVTITQPINGAILNALTTIKANAIDNEGVKNVVFYVDGDSVFTDTESPYEYEWDICVFDSTSHSILLEVEDDSGNKGQSNLIIVTTDGVYDCAGVCGGELVDIDNDGLCDNIDDCVGEFDECGVCNGDGILEGNCDCDDNIEDCSGECGGDAVEDECGLCNGIGADFECSDGSYVCDASDCADHLTTYEFISRFQNTSSVKYTGQTVRNLLIRDIKGNVADGVTAAELLVFYDNSDATALIATSSSYHADQIFYHDISTSNLSGKIASSSFDFDPGNVIGYDMTPDALLNAWFAAAENEGYQTLEGVRLDQMIAKGLAAMVAYYQATSVYFHPNKLDVADNTVSVNDDYGYTNMEHYWDESFGFFGASVDYLNLSSTNQRGAYDTDASGSIDYKTEYNFDWAAYAAKRDDCTGCDHDGSFASTIMGAYIDGREAITAQDGVSGYDPHRMTIVNTWEKVIAANIVHYINDLQDDITIGSSDINKSWSQMRVFALALQFNYFKIISDSDLTEMITLMGNTPSSDISYIDTMDQIKTMIGEIYMFTANDLANW